MRVTTTRGRARPATHYGRGTRSVCLSVSLSLSSSLEWVPASTSHREDDQHAKSARRALASHDEGPRLAHEREELHALVVVVAVVVAAQLKVCIFAVRWICWGPSKKNVLGQWIAQLHVGPKKTEKQSFWGYSPPFFLHSVFGVGIFSQKIDTLHLFLSSHLKFWRCFAS